MVKKFLDSQETDSYPICGCSHGETHRDAAQGCISRPGEVKVRAKLRSTVLRVKRQGHIIDSRWIDNNSPPPILQKTHDATGEQLFFVLFCNVGDVCSKSQTQT